MYVILQLQHSVGDVSNSTSSTVQSLTELVVFFYFISCVFDGQLYQVLFTTHWDVPPKDIVISCAVLWQHVFQAMVCVLSAGQRDTPQPETQVATILHNF